MHDWQQSLDVHAILTKLASIQKSSSTYASGLRAWGVFCDLMRIPSHFPAREQDVERFSGVFRNPATYSLYLKHLRFAHRLLRLPTGWHTDAVKQLERGAAKCRPEPVRRPAILAPEARRVIKAAMARNDVEMAAMYAIARLYMLRVPSECIPLQVAGGHSEIHTQEKAASIILFRRKNFQTPTVVHRHCVCETEGRTLCGVCWLVEWIRGMGPRPSGRLFDITATTFTKHLRRDVLSAGVAQAPKLGSHCWRRGMAQDLVNAGGSLATLLRVGQWKSSAFCMYLSEHSVDELAISKLIIDHSDDEGE